MLQQFPSNFSGLGLERVRPAVNQSATGMPNRYRMRKDEDFSQVINFLSHTEECQGK